MNYPFSMLNERYLGNGNPKGSLWLISGFEEAGDWKSRQRIEEFFTENNSVFGFYPFERGQVPKQKQQFYKDQINLLQKGRFTPIYTYLSKFILWSKIGYKAKDLDLKTYRDNYLFTKQEKACQVNLYPLGRPNQNKWPGHYENLFGISNSKEDQKLYKREVKIKRIPKIKKIWEDYAKVTVCIGKKRWDEFTQLFQLEGKTPIIKNFGKRTVKIYSVGFKKIIIFSYFFQGMSDIEALFISKRIRENISF